VGQKTHKETRTVATELTGDAAALVAALERLRDGGFDVDELSVGAAAIKLHRPAGDRERVDERLDGGILEAFGGELYRRAAAEKVPGTDLQPAIGRGG